METTTAAYDGETLLWTALNWVRIGEDFDSYSCLWLHGTARISFTLEKKQNYTLHCVMTKCRKSGVNGNDNGGLRRRDSGLNSAELGRSMLYYSRRSMQACMNKAVLRSTHLCIGASKLATEKFRFWRFIPVKWVSTLKYLQSTGVSLGKS